MLLKAVYADLDNFCALPEGCQAQYLRNPVNKHGYELRHSFNITTLSAAAMPAQEEVPESSASHSPRVSCRYAAE
ncbi:unnamed protein product [Leptidea sinapis]|uniref:Uncharacterized protein n=1 Tax=Leptidea sinapis TaxID=189913 RepID=A0A5E4PWP4_9NEOP|nr:unnamed protein product [Leptidea sinapis]